MITCSCKNCGVTYAATMIYGGIDIDAETTEVIADAYLKGDKVELLDDVSVLMSECKCL